MASISTLIKRVRSGVSGIELVYTSHGRWPLPRSSSYDGLHISILDSSFNPPSLAHLALVNAPRPFAAEPSHAREPLDYDAKLLLLSVRNADKQLKPGDADYVQRLEMMILLARDIVHPRAPVRGDHTQDLLSVEPHDNVAVAIIDEPTFVGKSRVLLEFLRHRLSSFRSTSPGAYRTAADTGASAIAEADPVKSHLTFLVGMDTLERLFAPRYYPSEVAMLHALRRFFSSDGDNATIVCARRFLPGTLRKDDEGHQFLHIVQEYLSDNRVTMIDIGEHEKRISSTEIRHLLRMGDPAWRTMVTSPIAEYIIQHRLYRVS